MADKEILRVAFEEKVRILNIKLKESNRLLTLSKKDYDNIISSLDNWDTICHTAQHYKWRNKYMTYHEVLKSFNTQDMPLQNFLIGKKEIERCTDAEYGLQVDKLKRYVFQEELFDLIYNSHVEEMTHAFFRKVDTNLKFQ